MKGKAFDVILHKLPLVQSPSLHARSSLKLVSSRMNTLILPAERNAIPGAEVAESVWLFFPNSL